ncbi:uncharacterized protein LOC109728790 [Ananas comosus]|uniref:Uncharacterized protein LOC109728790 n=1 Tax=Ananas comosus TaxID=4615 RepID=A0A6P5H677_ANACO|nr:uncharacterized protein LOC109728790 [Ananas comosus]
MVLNPPPPTMTFAKLLSRPSRGFVSGLGVASLCEKGRRVAREERAMSAAAAAAAGAGGRWEGVDEKVARVVAEANLDHAPDRRRVREAFKEAQLGIDHCLFKVFRGFVPLVRSFLDLRHSWVCPIRFCC